MKTTKTTLISAQGEVVHIKSKQTGKVILKLKLLPDQSGYDLLIDACDESMTYSFDAMARQTIAKFEGLK